MSEKVKNMMSWLVSCVVNAWLIEWDSDAVDEMYGEHTDKYWPTGTVDSLYKLVVNDLELFKRMMWDYTESPGFDHLFTSVDGRGRIDVEFSDLETIDDLTIANIVDFIVDILREFQDD